jgi:hypothetical protein
MGKYEDKWTAETRANLVKEWNLQKSTDENPKDNTRLIASLARSFDEEYSFFIQRILLEEGVSFEEIDNQETMLWTDVAQYSTHQYISNSTGGIPHHLKYDSQADERWELELPYYWVFFLYSVSDDYKEHIKYINELCDKDEKELTDFDKGILQVELRVAQKVALLYHYSEWFKVMKKQVAEWKSFGLKRTTTFDE